MGNCTSLCSANALCGGGLIHDLPVPEYYDENDYLEEFELCDLPFPRAHIFVMRNMCEQAHIECGSQGFVTIDSLAQRLCSPAWRPLRNQESDLIHFLQKYMAFGDGTDPFKLDYRSLLIWSMLHC